MFDTPPETEQTPEPSNLPAVPVKDHTQVALAMLAREIAMNINEIEIILPHYGLTPEQFAVIKKNDFFKRVLTAETAAWQAASNTIERTRLSAAAIVEQGLPVLGARMMKETEPLSSAVEAGKLLTKIAGIGENNSAQASSEKFNILINIGTEQLRYNPDVAPKTALALPIENV